MSATKEHHHDTIEKGMRSIFSPCGEGENQCNCLQRTCIKNRFNVFYTVLAIWCGLISTNFN